MEDRKGKEELDEICDEWVALLDIPMNPKKKEILEKTVDAAVEGNFALKDILHVDPKVLEFLEHQASVRYNAGQYDQAFALYQLLSSFDPTCGRYYFGMGASFHMVEGYTEAIFYYLMAGFLDKTNPHAFYHAVYCIYKTGNVEGAAALGRKVIERIDEEKFPKIKNDLEAFVEGLESSLVKAEKG